MARDSTPSVTLFPADLHEHTGAADVGGVVEGAVRVRLVLCHANAAQPTCGRRSPLVMRVGKTAAHFVLLRASMRTRALLLPDEFALGTALPSSLCTLFTNPFQLSARTQVFWKALKFAQHRAFDVDGSVMWVLRQGAFFHLHARVCLVLVPLPPGGDPSLRVHEAITAAFSDWSVGSEGGDSLGYAQFSAAMKRLSSTWATDPENPAERKAFLQHLCSRVISTGRRVSRHT